MYEELGLTVMLWEHLAWSLPAGVALSAEVPLRVGVETAAPLEAAQVHPSRPASKPPLRARSTSAAPATGAVATRAPAASRRAEETARSPENLTVGPVRCTTASAQGEFGVGVRITWSRPIRLSRPLAAGSALRAFRADVPGGRAGRLVHREFEESGVGEGPRAVRRDQPAHSPPARPGYGTTIQVPRPQPLIPVPSQRETVPGGTKKPMRDSPESARTGPGRSIRRVRMSSVG